MNDAEAEAILRALGEPLKWAAWTREVHIAETTVGTYRILKRNKVNGGVHPSPITPVTGTHVSPHVYKA